MLSDACSNYLASDDSIIGATQQLARDVEDYSDRLFEYPDEMIDALHIACENVLDHGDVANHRGPETILNSDLAHRRDCGGR